MHLGLRLLGVGPGDEVIAPSFTFVASVNPIRYLGATPVFVDSDRDTWMMDPRLLETALTEKAAAGRLPKAVVVVHLYGQCTDMDPVLEVCQRHGVPVLEDAAEALGSVYKGKPAGSMGDVGAFSFNGNKIVTTTGGGMLAARRKDWVEKARFWSTQARDEGSPTTTRRSATTTASPTCWRGSAAGSSRCSIGGWSSVVRSPSGTATRSPTSRRSRSCRRRPTACTPTGSPASSSTRGGAA
jgi:dTDP-4-amino-4,6-dideoxygalactose transaminase